MNKFSRRKITVKEELYIIVVKMIIGWSYLVYTFTYCAPREGIRAGAGGEMSSDIYLTQRGYQPLHPRKTALTHGWGETGIDGIFVKDGQYYIVEAKYTGTSALQNTNDGRQMSDPWIQARNYERIRNAIEDESTVNEIINQGYHRIIAKTAPDGTIVYKLVDEFGYIILGNAGKFNP
jgi:hypothetical protein